MLSKVYADIRKVSLEKGRQNKNDSAVLKWLFTFILMIWTIYRHN